MFKTNHIKAIVVLPLLLLMATPSIAETPEEKGLAIATEGDKRDTGFVDSTVDMKMTLTNRNGDTSNRMMRSRTLEMENDGDKGLTIFDKPADVRGTAMLTFTHLKGNDDQWIYLPALKRVKRISASNKSGPFMGSEFAYEDLGSQELPKYSYRWLRDEELNGQQMYVIERIPTYKKSGYTRMVSWIDKEEYRAFKVEYFDRKSSHLKTLILSDYKQYKNKFWRPNRLEMTNHQNGKASLLEFSNYKFQTGLKDRDFNKNGLKRIR